MREEAGLFNNVKGELKPCYNFGGFSYPSFTINPVDVNELFFPINEYDRHWEAVLKTSTYDNWISSIPEKIIWTLASNKLKWPENEQDFPLE